MAHQGCCDQGSLQIFTQDSVDAYRIVCVILQMTLNVFKRGFCKCLQRCLQVYTGKSVSV